jgi:putative endonuclease
LFRVPCAAESRDLTRFWQEFATSKSNELYVIRHPAVNICASDSRVLYVGVTSNLLWRMWRHKNGVYEGFSKKYHVNRLVYYESSPNMKAAIAREKQIKAWRRDKKVWLVERENPAWRDLAENWHEDPYWSVPEQPEVGVYWHLQ